MTDNRKRAAGVISFYVGLRAAGSDDTDGLAAAIASAVDEAEARGRADMAAKVEQAAARYESDPLIGAVVAGALRASITEEIR